MQPPGAISLQLSSHSRYPTNYRPLRPKATSSSEIRAQPFRTEPFSPEVFENGATATAGPGLQLPTKSINPQDREGSLYTSV